VDGVRLYPVIHTSLYVSGFPRTTKDWAEIKRQGITFLVTLSKKQPDVTRDYGWLYYHVPDGKTVPVMSLDVVKSFVIKRIANKHRVLVHCLGGINRSMLLAGLVYQELTGCTGADALAHLRSLRRGCLKNSVFEEYLRNR